LLNFVVAYHVHGNDFAATFRRQAPIHEGRVVYGLGDGQGVL
jgi:hypothetical protein